MASVLVQQNEFKNAIRYYNIEETRKIFRKSTIELKGKVFWSMVWFPFSPAISLYFLIMAMIVIYRDFFSIFFKTDAHVSKYSFMLAPQTSNKVVSVVGYRVYDSELDEHLSIIGDGPSLLEKQKRMESGDIMRHVGIDAKMAKTHLAMCGKTGAGKTEGLRSMMEDIFRFGGGVNMNDGKSDSGMLNEIQIQAKACNRETSVQVLNFLKAEKSAETNTFNPIAIMHPVKAVEFLAGLAFKGGGDGGNSAYFQARGKAMLLPIINGLALRDEMLEEGVDTEKIRENAQIINLIILSASFYCICRDINNIIERNQDVKRMLSKNSIVTVSSPHFENIERLIALVIEEPTKKRVLEEKLGINFRFIKESYNNVYMLLRSYLGNVWNQFIPLCDGVSSAIYYIGTKEAKCFYITGGGRDDIYSLNEIKAFYNEVKNAALSDGGFQIFYKNYLQPFGMTVNDAKTIQAAFKSQEGTIENPPADAIQQHSYAQQQWDALFNVFTAYKHIFAQRRSEINPKRLLLDNKILYSLLPALELSRDQVEILGKILIMTMKEIAGIALGGEFISTHSTIKNINRDKFTPKPFTLVNLDEYGAYPVPDLDTILAQVRSINICVAIGIQDFVSLKASGEDETSQKRALANTTKWCFKTADKDLIEWLDTMIADQDVEKGKFSRSATGEIIETGDIEYTKEKLINPNKLQDFDNGFSMLFAGSGQERCIYLQTFYRGGKAGNVYLRRYNNLDLPSEGK